MSSDYWAIVSDLLSFPLFLCSGSVFSSKNMLKVHLSEDLENQLKAFLVVVVVIVVVTPRSSSSSSSSSSNDSP